MTLPSEKSILSHDTKHGLTFNEQPIFSVKTEDKNVHSHCKVLEVYIVMTQEKNVSQKGPQK